MMALENRENMQINCGTSPECLQGKGALCNLHRSGSSTELFTRELKNHPGTYTSGYMAETDCLLAACLYNCHQVQQYQVNGLESRVYPYPFENQLQYVPINMFADGYPHNLQYQEFQYFVVMDFEATCEKDKVPHPQEIIEFPSVIVNGVTGQLEACFRTYVRPTCNPLLSDYCKDLTGIQQIQVDKGITLSDALLRHDEWLESKGIKNTNFAVVTWGNWDCRVALESECRFKKISKPPYFNRWINLKIPFQEVFGARCNVKEAVEMAGLAWQGRHHCGLDDATNTARLMVLLMHRGYKFSITGSIMGQNEDQSLMWKQQSQEQLRNLPYSPHKAKDVNKPTFQYNNPCCYCGVKSSRVMVRKPGPKQGSYFFGCGNWTATRGACCQYFEWAA